ncbi:hypothetical protein OG592_43030 (plasmid) [Streptomyces avidinii]|uniref:hypothetical protein n=1 Tax=Streptomyces avidinii TaxID=1895 RepID=UPI002F91155A|nr:hypothetical protein OG592_43030 [Streptomyces avidinii]
MDLTEIVDRHDFYSVFAGQLELLEPEEVPGSRLSRRPKLPAKFHPAYLLLEVISKTAGPEESSRVMRAALRAHRSYKSDRSIARTLGFRLLAFKELRIAAGLPGDGDVSEGAGWAVQILESIRVSLGDAAFASFIECANTAMRRLQEDRELSLA